MKANVLWVFEAPISSHRTQTTHRWNRQLWQYLKMPQWIILLEMHLWLVLTNRVPQSEAVPVLGPAFERTGGVCFLNCEHLLWRAWITLQEVQLPCWRHPMDGPLGSHVKRRGPETTWSVTENQLFQCWASWWLWLEPCLTRTSLETPKEVSLKPPSRAQSTHRIVRAN